MTALDTSVAIPALLAWHADHAACRVAAVGCVIPAHAYLEAYAVLTRLPSPHRLAARVAGTLLHGRFAADAVIGAAVDRSRSMVEELAQAGVAGGAGYDGYVALTARDHGHRLLTRDARAVRTYQSLGVEYALVTSAM